MIVPKVSETEVLETDVLVIGGGIAGCFAGIRAKEAGVNVILVEKGNVGRSGYSPMISGVLTYFDQQKDNYNDWYYECVESGQWLNDQERLPFIINECGERVKELDSWGVTFQKEDGEFLRMPGEAHRHARNVHLTNSGLQMMLVVRGEVLRRGVHVIERIMVTDLLTSDGELPTNDRVVGAVGFNVRTGKFYVFKAKSVVIATGATADMHFHVSVPILSGDGRAMAFRAGCEMRNLEVLFYSPAPKDLNCAAALNILASEGFHVINAKGERFMHKWDPVRLERAPRPVLCRAIHTEELEGRGPVFWSASHFDKAAYHRMEMCVPIVIRSLTLAGFDYRRDKIPYTPTLEDHGPGGIRTDVENATTIPALYAAGSVSDLGEEGVNPVVHSAIGSAIGGCHAGQAAAHYAGEIGRTNVNGRQVQLLKDEIFAPMKRESGLKHQEVRRHCKSIIARGLVGPIRNEKRLKEAIDIAQEIREEEIPKLVANDYHELARCIGLSNGLLFLELLPRCALFRTESRGSHYRDDYPERDNANWLRWVIAKSSGDGIKVWAEPIPFERYPLKPDLTG
jgi:succinate dehydrogenase/fumarate reductase flavoprotein subunit